MDYDIAVIGAGPAGVISANMLAARGYRVALIHQPRRYPVLEGLSQRAVTGLQYAHCHHALAQISAPVPRAACWNGADVQANTEYLIERQCFDAALLKDADAAGVSLLRQRASRIHRQTVGWIINLAGRSLCAAYLIDARGRAAPRHRNQSHRGPLTIALCQRWQTSKAPLPRTLVAAFATGWAWFAARDNGEVLVQISVARVPQRQDLSRYYHHTLRQIPEIITVLKQLEGAQPQGPVFARYAHAQRAHKLITAHSARVGDAAFAIDPLSGHGIYQAVGGALALAAAVHTCCSQPEQSALAGQFYRTRIESDFLRQCRIGRDFYRQEQRWAQQSFWRERAHWPDQHPSHAPASGDVRIEQRPVNIDGLICAREVVITPDHPRGLWQIAGIDVVDLLRYTQQSLPQQTVQQWAMAYAEHQNQQPQNVLTALAWLQARGLINEPHSA